MEKKGQFIKIKFGWLELVERLKEIPGTKAFKLDHYSKIFLLPRLIVRTNVMFNYNIPWPKTNCFLGLKVWFKKELEVGKLWDFIRPWKYTSNVLKYFKDRRITEKSLKERLEKAF